ncbi:hypothetical protein pb186bvf_001347 [Paramecium bursaria]
MNKEIIQEYLADQSYKLCFEKLGPNGTPETFQMCLENYILAYEAVRIGYTAYFSRAKK